MCVCVCARALRLCLHEMSSKLHCILSACWILSGDMVTAADVGKRVTVEGYSCSGVLRFFGMHHERNSPRCGVELDEPFGKNNGTVGGHVYFSCNDRHGVLCTPEKVSLL